MATITGAIIIWLNPIRNNVSILPLPLKCAPTILIFTGIILSYLISKRNKIITSISNNINHYASCIIWFLVPLSTQFLLIYPSKFAHLNLKIIDQGWIELPQLIHSSLTLNNSSIIIYSPAQAAQIIISITLTTAIFITLIN
jgi:hypothetical protein